MRPRRRADGVVLAVFEILRALCAGDDVIARIVLARARPVVEGSTVNELLVGDGDPHVVGRVTLRYGFRAARLFTREEDVCLFVVREGLGLGRRDTRVGGEVVGWMNVASTS